MAGYIDIRLQAMEVPSKYDVNVRVPLSENLIERTLVSVDFPTPEADVFSKVLCSSPAQIKEVLLDRERIAERLTGLLVRELMKGMAKNDKLMGYQKENPNDEYGGIR